MYSKKGYSLIEITVVSSLILIALTLMLAWHSSTASVEKEDTVEQEYFNTLAMLEFRLKKDIRSAFTITPRGNNSYVLEIPSINNQGFWNLSRVEYKLADDDKKIIRTSDRGDKEYDFSKYLGKKKFIFRIVR